MEAAGLVIVNARVITVDPAGSVAEAVACRGEEILAVGSGREILGLADADTVTIDAGGRAVVPGLVDGHAHMDREGLKGVFPSLEGCRSVADVLGRVRALAERAAPGEWIVTMPVGDPPHYWNVPGCLEEGRFPTRWELDEAAPDNPVYIRAIWGFWRHELPLVSIANTRALDLAGIGRGSEPATPTIVFERDGAGELTGVIRETAFMPVAELGYFHMAPGFTPEDRVRGLERAMGIYNATATTSVLEEHGAAQELVDAYRAVHAAGTATVRARLVHSPSWGGGDHAAALAGWAGEIGGLGRGDDWLRVAGLFTDIGVDADARLRATAAPYTGWAGFNYDTGVPEGRIVDVMAEAARRDIRVAVIGPRFLDVFEEVDRRVPLAGRRWIIGHLDVMDERRIRQAADLGVVMTTHTNRYIYKHGLRIREGLGRRRESDIVPLRRLLDAGVPVGLATDNVPTTLFHPLWHVVSRRNMLSEDRIAPDQALSREEALRCATMGGAFLTFDEGRKGSLEAGKLADMAVLSGDPLTCAEDDIKDIVAETTVVGGRVVYRRGGEA